MCITRETIEAHLDNNLMLDTSWKWYETMHMLTIISSQYKQYVIDNSSTHDLT
jgi:hypothetical protein